MTIDNQSESQDSAEARRRYLDILPFYLNGTLPDTDRQWVMDYLTHNPHMQSTLAWHADLSEQVRISTEQRLAGIPANIGLKGLKRKLREERTKKIKWSGLWETLMSARWLPSAFAAAMLLVVVQSVFLGVMLSKEDTATAPLVRSVTEVAPKEKIRYLQVNFKADVTERDLRLELIETGARIIDGPGQLGDYVVAVPDKRLEDVRKHLEQSDLIESVKPIEQPPAPE